MKDEKVFPSKEDALLRFLTVIESSYFLTPWGSAVAL